jgi:hypothetical protein
MATTFAHLQKNGCGDNMHFDSLVTSVLDEPLKTQEQLLEKILLKPPDPGGGIQSSPQPTICMIAKESTEIENGQCTMSFC